MRPLKAPFPYFGGKSKVAALVWERLGKVQNFVEPCFGSGAILLSCPHPGHTETVNDADGLLANFWRATQYAPDEVAAYADWPVNEADLHARHRWLVDRRSMVEQLMADPEWFDAQAAGWWVWGISQWIGDGWCPVIGTKSRNGSRLSADGQGIHRKMPEVASSRGGHRDLTHPMPHLSDAGTGVSRASIGNLSQRIPHLGGEYAAGQGVGYARLAQQLPDLGSNRGVSAIAAQLPHHMPFIASPAADRKQHGQGVHGAGIQGALYDYFRSLSARLRRTRVVCGDFERILGDSVTWRHGLTAVFLDPPYADAEHAVTYSGGSNVWERATKWCEENGTHPQLRIALCGYADTWEAPHGWEMIRWRTSGGYGSQGNARGRVNANREAIWFSPACLNPSMEARDRLSQPIVVGESDYSGTMFDFAEEDA